MKTILFSFALLATSAAVESNSKAAVIHEWDFESPEFTVGPVNGQDGWFGKGEIQSLVYRGGSQSLKVTAESVGDQSYFIQVQHGLSYTLAPHLLLTTDFLCQGTGSGIGAGFQVQFNSGWQADVGTRVGNEKFFLSNSFSSINAGSFVPNQWYKLQLKINFPGRTVEGLVDGVSLGVLPLAQETPPTGVTRIHLFISTTVSGDAAYFDNLSIVAVPEASGTLWVTALGLVGFAAVRRRQIH